MCRFYLQVLLQFQYNLNNHYRRTLIAQIVYSCECDFSTLSNLVFMQES